MLVVKCNNTTYCYDKTYIITHCTYVNGTVAGTECDCYSNDGATATLCINCSNVSTSVPIYSTKFLNCNCVTYSCCRNGICYIRTSTGAHPMYVCCGSKYYYSNPTSNGLRKGIPPGLYSGPTLFAILCRMIGLNEGVKACTRFCISGLFKMCDSCPILQIENRGNGTFSYVRAFTAKVTSCSTKCLVGRWVVFSNDTGYGGHEAMQYNVGCWTDANNPSYLQLKANHITNCKLYLVCISTPIFFS